ncbi:MAG: ABC transporter substrate-binding protein [Spirochaetales bacterium]|nr:ABC transporter substrate-binding protein [Spirochaetales bacterium]
MKVRISLAILLCTAFILTGCGPGAGQGPTVEDNSIAFGYEAMPNSLNYLIDYNSFSIYVGQLLYETLTELNYDTFELQPRLAESWKISDDKMTYTFILDKDAQWADGSPVTTDDILFTYNTIMDPKNLTSIFRSDYENSFLKVYALDSRTIVFKAKTNRWSNFYSACFFVVLPKEAYSGKDFNKDFNLTLPPGSGPYIIDTIEPDRFIQLKKRSDFWCKKLPSKRNMYNFETIKIKFISEDSVRIEALKKGDINYFPVSSAKNWVELTQNNVPDQIKKNWILAKRIWNKAPQGYQGFEMNLRRDKFKDLRIRQALAMLLNIDLINEKIMYNQYTRLRSYFPSFFGQDKDLPLIPYDPDQARKLLAEAGWDKVGNDGILVNKNGQRFSIDFLYSSQSLEKHLTIFKEDCKKVGVQVNLSLISAASWRKKVFEDHDFDITWGAWGPGVPYPSVEDGWKSDRADLPNSNNITGYKNPSLDKLIDAYLMEYDIPKRVALLKKIDLTLTSDMPTILLWGAPYIRILYWNKYGMIPTVLKKYDDSNSEDSPYTNWWLDAQKLKALIDARANNAVLPSEPIEVHIEK